MIAPHIYSDFLESSPSLHTLLHHSLALVADFAAKPYAMSLDRLPTEIQCFIIRLLEPISLISISHTNSHFRQLVRPEKKHFAERLLALESLEKHGGITPIFRSRDNDLDPDWTDARWSAMRWACTDCLRLLPHECFDNHSILRLRYRKPVPESAASKLVTTWEPAKLSKARQHCREPKGLVADQRQFRELYSICVTSGRGAVPVSEGPMINRLDVLQRCGIVGPDGVSEWDGLTRPLKLQRLDRLALFIELDRCGTKRSLRKCNECRYLGGKLAPRLSGYGGTLKLPIVPSRRIMFGTQIDRYFPGISGFLDHKRPLYDPPLTRIHRQDAYGELWTMYMVRCPSCTRWQELREFRLGGEYQHWKPVMATAGSDATFTWNDKEITESLLEGSLCNDCFVQTHGRYALTKVLLPWFNHLIMLQLLILNWQLKSGWSQLRSLLMPGIPQEYQTEVRDLMRHPASLHSHSYDALTDEDVALLKLRHAQWKEIWDRMKSNGDTDWTEEDMDAWYDTCMRRFNETEGHWRWLMACRDELEEKPGALANWAMYREKGLFS
ncbi:hypothetical protein AK830_g11471 [Neonectria ditissima]|uniref:F-box domain-containing protein n=1 Tax=Neonectria ditissima TaxID=78410 RepID=A0A0P7AMC3_9HYPO|nr:hypothetical protein AK830_g11471 [Neonectria ditissima]